MATCHLAPRCTQGLHLQHRVAAWPWASTARVRPWGMGRPWVDHGFRSRVSNGLEVIAPSAHRDCACLILYVQQIQILNSQRREKLIYIPCSVLCGS